MTRLCPPHCPIELFRYLRNRRSPLDRKPFKPTVGEADLGFLLVKFPVLTLKPLKSSAEVRAYATTPRFRKVAGKIDHRSACFYWQVFLGIRSQAGLDPVGSAAGQNAAIGRPTAARARSFAPILWCPGSRCCTRTKAKPVSAGNARKSREKASSAPAEAPIPTAGATFRAAGDASPEVRLASSFTTLALRRILAGADALLRFREGLFLPRFFIGKSCSEAKSGTGPLQSKRGYWIFQ